MAQSPDWKQFLDAGMQFTALTRAQAQRRARELVREGQLAQERMQAFVDELLETSRKRADEFVEIVRHEVERQLRTLGITSRTAKRAAAATKKAAPKKTAKKKAPATKTAATKKKAAPKKAAKKKATAKKAAAKSTAKKSP
jgi:polyhydroxyalkanoate synthesis regulator phasin